MKIQKIISILEKWAPRAYAEEFDNVGLLVGKSKAECTGILITHDVLENVVDEAITKKYNLIICFHPIIFSALKKLTEKTYVERVVAKAIKNDIAIYAIHTALDNLKKGGCAKGLADLRIADDFLLRHLANARSPACLFFCGAEDRLKLSHGQRELSKCRRKGYSFAKR